jgi:hypothetical protein
MNTTLRSTLIAGGIAVVAVSAIAGAALIPGDDTTSGPRTVKIQEAGAQVDDTTASMSTTKVVPIEPTVPTLAPGFEDYKAGDELPARADLPAEGEAVETVPGPYGPIYPDGYADDSDDVTQRTAPPPPAPNDDH